MNSTDPQLEKTEIWISHILRWGVFACAGIIFAGWMSSSPEVIRWGLLLLIGVPVARVFAAGVIFLRQRDWIYVGFSAFVLVILIASLLLGKKL